MRPTCNIVALLIAMGLLMLPAQVARAADLILNGNFEQPATEAPEWYTVCPPSGLQGWEVTAGTVDVVEVNNYFAAPAPSGAQCLDLDGTPGPATCIQSFATVPGATYELSFAYANNYVFASDASATVRVFDSSGNRLGPLVITHNSSARGNLDWQCYTNTFVATEAIASLEFISLSGPGALSGILLDAVAVRGPAAAPELVIELSPGGSKLTLCWASVSNATYRVEYRSDLTSGNWIPLVECVSGNGGVVCLDADMGLGESQGFYRVSIVDCVP